MRPSRYIPVIVACAVVTMSVIAVVVVQRNKTDTALPHVTLPAKGSNQRMFGPNAPWNRPVSELGRSEHYASYAERFWKYATLENATNSSTRGHYSTYFNAYSIPIYDAREATGTRKVLTANTGYPGTLPDGSEVPWNDAWKPATGNDQSMLIINPDNGRDYELWLVQTSNFSACLSHGFEAIRALCVGSANLIPDLNGQPADYRTYEGGFITRGSGLQKLAMMTTADEVASGSVQHALSMVAFNTMFGPACSPAERTTAAEGTTCGFYVNPATRIEWAKGPSQQCTVPLENTTAGRSTTVPEGMRFALDITDDQINTWLDSRGYQGVLRDTARVFAVALRDYGWIISDTSCADAGIETEGMTNPIAHAKWKQLGVPDGPDSQSMLWGLFTQQRIYVVNPPAAATPVSTKLAPGVR